MFYYLFILFLCFFLKFLKIDSTKKGKKFFVIIIFILLTTLAAFRAYTVGVDTFQYYRNYVNIGQDLFFNYTSRYEKGFFYLCKFLYSICSDPQTLIFSTSIFIIPVVGYFIYKNSDDIFMSIFVYITLGLYFFNLTGMRQSLALAICLLAHDYLKNNSMKKYFIFVLIASLFHTSALVFLVFPFFKSIKYSKNSYFLTLFISCVSFLLGKFFISFILNFFGRYAGYLGSEFAVSNYFGALFQFLLYVFIYTICHFTFIKYTDNLNDDNNSLYMKYLSICVILSSLTMQVNIVGRFTPYFAIFVVVLISNLKNKINHAKTRLFYIVTFIVLFLLYFGIIEFFRPEWNGVQPYRFFWELF